MEVRAVDESTYVGDLEGVYARVIEASVSTFGEKIYTVEAQIHRFVLAELNTHRALSKNSASSRAIPVAKQLAKVETNPAIPFFASEKKGMQGGNEVEDPDTAREEWLAARDSAVQHAESLLDLNVHKSVVNRILEPYMWHRVILTGTDWAGFFHQRCSPLAQPEIRQAAECIRSAMAQATPVQRNSGEWHLPYVYENERDHPLAPQISAARCARVSYLTHDGRHDVEADISLFDKLNGADPKHWSPMEHPAMPLSGRHSVPRSNLKGWLSLRKQLDEETEQPIFILPSPNRLW